MKTFISGLTLLLTLSAQANVRERYLEDHPVQSTGAYFGTPEEDPVIQYLQNKFAEARLPVESELRFGNIWNCKAFSSVQGESFTANRTFKFWAFDGVVLNSGDYGVKSLVYGARALAGMGSITDGVIALRISPQKELIVEHSITRQQAAKFSNKSQLITPAIYSPTGIAIDYAVCLPGESVPKAPAAKAPPQVF